MGTNWAGTLFPHPDKIKHQPCAGGYLGGEKLGWSILTTFAYLGVGKNWPGPFFTHPILYPPRLVKVSTLPCHEYTYNLFFLGDGEKLGRPILSPPWQDKASTLCMWLSVWRKTRLVHSFPSLTSESINHTQSWIHIQPFLLSGGEKLGLPILSPPWLVKVSILCRS